MSCRKPDVEAEVGVSWVGTVDYVETDHLLVNTREWLCHTRLVSNRGLGEDGPAIGLNNISPITAEPRLTGRREQV
jgi:hypothetical protein